MNATREPTNMVEAHEQWLAKHCPDCEHPKNWHRGDVCGIDCPCPNEWFQ